MPQLPAIRRLAKVHDAAPTTEGHWMRGLDFYPPAQLTRVLVRTFTRYHYFHSRYPDLVAPRGFNEWVVRSNFLRWMKIPDSGNKLFTSSFIPEPMRAQVRCPPVLWHGAQVSQEVLHQLPTGGSYFLKATHGSSMSQRFGWPLSESEQSRLSQAGAGWLNTRYGLLDGEWWYDASPPELLIEADVGGTDFSVNCFCFKGRVGLVVLHAKVTGETITLSEKFDVLGHRNGNTEWRTVFEPGLLQQINGLASELSQEIEFARFDFLVGASGEVFLGEVTFSPGNGCSQRPDGIDERLGQMWADSVAG